jgi:hypothetical protein
MADTASRKRVVGLALFASAGLTVVIAILIGTGVIPIDESVRSIVAGVLAVVAIADAFIGWRFLMAASA